MTVALLASGCSLFESGTSVALEQDFILEPGAKVKIEGQELEIEFLSVSEDSRCSSGVTCVQAGRALIALEVKLNGHKYYSILIQPGLTQEYTVKNYQNEYLISFVLKPYPVSGQTISAGEYRLQMKVSLL